jgi:hypothetical protein
MRRVGLITARYCSSKHFEDRVNDFVNIQYTTYHSVVGRSLPCMRVQTDRCVYISLKPVEIPGGIFAVVVIRARTVLMCSTLICYIPEGHFEITISLIMHTRT